MKKLLNFWRILTFKWINSDNMNTKEYLLIRCINEKSDTVHEALAITEERSHELIDMCVKAFEDTTKFTDAMALVSQKCKHANELMYTTYIMVDIRNQLNNPLERLFKMMHSRPKE